MKRPVSVVGLLIILVVSSVEADNRFYRVLATKPNATFQDAVQAFFELALDVPAGDLSFERQAQALVDMKVIKKKWTDKPNILLTRGRTAYMLCRTCRIRGGVTMRVLGTSERYAFRECRYLRVWPRGTQRDFMTGGELMGVLKWAADYLETHPKRKLQPRGSALTLVRERRVEPVAPETPPEAETEGPPPAVPEEAAGPPGTRYVVQQGDTFARISEKFYGTVRHDVDIMKANGIDDPWKLRVGQTLIIPTVSGKPEEAPEEEAPTEKKE